MAAPPSARFESTDAAPAESAPPLPAADATTTGATPESTATNPSAPSDEDNRRLYERGKSAYARGDYETAIAIFAEVHQRTGHPALIFNMAQAHRLAGPDHCLEAFRLYRSYLTHDPDVPNGQEVRERIAELEECAQAAEAREAQAAPPAPAPETPTAARVLTFAGGAVLAAGLGLFTASKIRFASAEDDCPCEPGRFSTWETLENVSFGLMAAGGTGLAVGGTWWWATMAPGPEEDVAFVGIAGTF